MSAHIELAKLSISFAERTVLTNVSARFDANGINVLIGRSGSGKTTLLRALNRLNDEFPGCRTTGTVCVDFGNGKRAVYQEASGNLPLIPTHILRRRFGMLFQSPNPLPVTIYKNLAMPLELLASCPKKDIAEKVREALVSVGLWEEIDGRLNMAAKRLSGGQQQRLCLARLLALEPDVLLLDEPTASLDVHAAARIEELLAQLAAKYTILMVSHSLSQARRLGSRLFICEAGEIRSEVAAQEELSDEMLATLM